MFIDASTIYKPQRAQNILEDEHVTHIFELYNQFKDIPHIARVVTQDEIKQNDCNLSISLYIKKEDTKVILTLDGAVLNLRNAINMSKAADEVLNRKLVGIGVIEQ